MGSQLMLLGLVQVYFATKTVSNLSAKRWYLDCELGVFLVRHKSNQSKCCLPFPLRARSTRT